MFRCVFILAISTKCPKGVFCNNIRDWLLQNQTSYFEFELSNQKIQVSADIMNTPTSKTAQTTLTQRNLNPLSFRLSLIQIAARENSCVIFVESVQKEQQWRDIFSRITNPKPVLGLFQKPQCRFFDELSVFGLHCHCCKEITTRPVVQFTEQCLIVNVGGSAKGLFAPATDLAVSECSGPEAVFHRCDFQLN